MCGDITSTGGAALQSSALPLQPFPHSEYFTSYLTYGSVLGFNAWYIFRLSLYLLCVRLFFLRRVSASLLSRSLSVWAPAEPKHGFEVSLKCLLSFTSFFRALTLDFIPKRWSGSHFFQRRLTIYCCWQQGVHSVNNDTANIWLEGLSLAATYELGSKKVGMPSRM